MKNQEKRTKKRTLVTLIILIVICYWLSIQNQITSLCELVD